MPIYAYRCESCGFAKDVLQKISDAPLTQCPSCGADAYRKQVTAAGFQLKGSGWYVTDFRGGSSNGNNSGTSAAATGAKDAKSGDAASSSEGGKSESASPASPAAAATTSAAPAASGTSGST
ncbi:FmdB family zinc ribbon protein [Paraburkholderia tropica]|uniref:Regulatory protein, FmdB family n=1 Tax=Paraburkholderia tropica TaxID=92647 RepID=A0AAQ1GLX9_9BURK|nr:FmdB family zinc ribbon protein [Paraburkholderia tropica]RQN34248.1 zinc ribbon domain-containing protein [Paraburkholderia tropica]SEK11675.1 putative regulatory protein, FmdB family [Paraburkholderia tropica]